MNPSELHPLVADMRICQMTPGEYASARVAVGDKVRRIGRLDWLAGKGLFYRPLLRYESYALGAADIPNVGLGGFQYVVSDPGEANSRIDYLAFDDLDGYSIDNVSHNRRRLVKAAAKVFSVHQISNLEELTTRGHQAYVSFYERTGYRYGSQRRRREDFANWAKATLDSSKAIVLGGYGADGLVAVSVSYWVYDKLLYTTFFSDTRALKKGVGELMLHSIRVLSSRNEGIKEIVVRPYQGGNAMDEYYIMRGAKLVHKPAKLHFHRLTGCLLRLLFPARYRLLEGIAGTPPCERSEEPELKLATRADNGSFSKEQR